MSATPRPWTVSILPSEGASIYGQLGGPLHRGQIASLTFGTKEQIAADAAIIVRAVNMLDVMEEAKTVLKSVLSAWHGKPSNFEKAEPVYLENVRAVLAKLEEKP